MYVLITGASSGIGREMARCFAECGCDLILAARRLERLQELGSELAATYGCHVIVKQTDLNDEHQVRALHAACLPLDPTVVVNCAGFGKMGYFTDISLEDELDMIKTNVTAVHILTKLFAQTMSKGTILNVSSIASFAPVPLLAAYGATKAYVQSLSRAVNYELKKQGKPVQVAVLCPGPVSTEFNDVADASFRIPAMSAKTCARLAVNGIFAARNVILPGLIPHAMNILAKLTPAALVMPFEFLGEKAKMKK